MAKRGQGEGSISKRADGTWWARITIGKDENGKQKRKAFYGKTRKEVQEKMTAALNDIQNDDYIELSNMSVGDWLDIWLNEYQKPSVRSSTYASTARHIEDGIKPQFGKYAVKNLRNDMVQRWVNEMTVNGDSAHKVRRAQNILSRALKQAVENEMIRKNVAEKVNLPKYEKKEALALTVDEQERLLEAIKEDSNRNSHNNEIFIMALGTGLRIGELLALTWCDIDFDEPSVEVNKSLQYIKTGKYMPDEIKDRMVINPPKTKSSYRTVPLIQSLVEMLQDIKKRQDKDKNRYITELKKVRESKGVGLFTISRDMGIAESTLYEWEAGNIQPTLFDLGELAKYYEVPITRFVDGMQREVVEFQNQSKKGSIKAGRTRVTLLSSKIEYDDDGYVFCSDRGKPLYATNLGKKFRNLCAKADVREGMHIHSLRHTFATRGLENGIDIKVMQTLLGHSTLNMTADTYTHVLPNQKANEIKKLDGMIQL